MWRNLQLAFCSNQNQGLSSEQRAFVKGQLRSGSRAKWGLSLVGAVHCSEWSRRSPDTRESKPWTPFPPTSPPGLVRVSNPLPKEVRRGTCLPWAQLDRSQSLFVPQESHRQAGPAPLIFINFYVVVVNAIYQLIVIIIFMSIIL